MTESWRKLVCSLICVVGMAVVSGCGAGDPTSDLGTPVTVTGKVTLDDKPLTGANIIFQRTDEGVPPKYRNFTVAVNDDGTYELKDVYPADYRVKFEEQNNDDEGDGAAALDTGRFTKYGLESKESAKVSESASSFDFSLTSQ